MNKAELRKAAKELGVPQCGVSVAELKAACKRAAGAAAKEACEEAEPEAGRSRAPEAERDFDAMNKAELRKAAKELGVPQYGVSVAELKAACKRAVPEQQQQTTLTAWMAGNARVAESAAAPPDSNPEHSGAGAVLGAVQEQQQETTLTAWMAGNARVAESAAAPPDSNPEHGGAGAVLGAARQALPAARKRIAVKVHARGRAANVRCGAGRCCGLPRSSDFSD